MIPITVDGTEYQVPSSQRDTNWAAAQVAFERAVVTYADDTQTVVDGVQADVAALSALIEPTGVRGTAGSGTGITSSSTSYGRSVLHRITVNYQALSYLSETDWQIDLWDMPAKTRIMRVLADVTQGFAGGSITNITMAVGGDTSDDCLLETDISSPSGVPIGMSQAEWGNNIVGGTGLVRDMHWIPASVFANFAADADFTNLTSGSVTFYIETCTYP